MLFDHPPHPRRLACFVTMKAFAAQTLRTVVVGAMLSSCAALPIVGPYAHLSAAVVNLECQQSFRIYDNAATTTMLVVPYSASEVAYAACARLSSKGQVIPLEGRSRQAAEEQLKKTNRAQCTLGPATVADGIGTMYELKYTCPVPAPLPGATPR